MKLDTDGRFEHFFMKTLCKYKKKITTCDSITDFLASISPQQNHASFPQDTITTLGGCDLFIQNPSEDDDDEVLSIPSLWY